MQNKKEIGSVEFIALVACIMLLTALAIDIMLPAFGELRTYFGLGADSTMTANIVTFFFLGQVGQIVFGPLADRYGRIPILRTGFVLYILGCLGAALLPTLGLILVARFVAGLGAAALSVGALTSVRDRFAGDKMARTMSFIMTIFLFVPIIAPLIGSAILTITSWQVVFLTPAVVGILVCVWSFRLHESLPAERRLSLDLPTIARSARQVAGNRVFVVYTAITTILFSPFSVYVSSSERMISEIYGRPELFAWIFSGVGITMAIFTFTNTRLIGRFGSRRTLRGFLTAYLIWAGLLLGLTLFGRGTPNILVFFAVVALLQGIYVAVDPNSSALALERLGGNAGMAAAIYGTSFFVIGSMLGSIINTFLVDSMLPLAVGYVIAGLISLALAYSGHTSVQPTVASTVRSEIGD
ncbi:MAG TPA: MFS transporter [Phototrophicaceae bacterium]|nr:MFS transporter [Phototrophicaceae bacterium]